MAFGSSSPSCPRQRWVPIRGMRLPRTPTKAETVTGRSWEGFEAQREAAQTAEKRLLKAVPMKAREGGRKRPPSHEQNVGRRRGAKAAPMSSQTEMGNVFSDSGEKAIVVIKRHRTLPNGLGVPVL